MFLGKEEKRREKTHTRTWVIVYVLKLWSNGRQGHFVFVINKMLLKIYTYTYYSVLDVSIQEHGERWINTIRIFCITCTCNIIMDSTTYEKWKIRKCEDIKGAKRRKAVVYMKPRWKMKKRIACQKWKIITQKIIKSRGKAGKSKKRRHTSRFIMALATLADTAKQRWLPRGRVFCLTYPRIVDNRWRILQTGM